MASIFTQIIRGEVPSHAVHRSTHSYAMMDIHPIQPGQVLVVSLREVENFYDLTDEEIADLMSTVAQVARQLKQQYPSCRRVGVMIEGLDVPHVHVKVFPISSSDEFRHEPDPAAEPDHQELARQAALLAF